MQKELSVYIISCHSNCGSYFQPYLKQITVIAKSLEHAKELINNWCKENRSNFLYDCSKWDIEVYTLNEGVMNHIIDSDY